MHDDDDGDIVVVVSAVIVTRNGLPLRIVFYETFWKNFSNTFDCGNHFILSSVASFALF